MEGGLELRDVVFHEKLLFEMSDLTLQIVSCAKGETLTELTVLAAVEHWGNTILKSMAKNGRLKDVLGLHLGS